MYRALILVCVSFLASCEQQEEQAVVGDEQNVRPAPEGFDPTTFTLNNPEGIFFRTVRQAPIRKVKIDLRAPWDISGIPEVEWVPLRGKHKFCAIQGTTDLHLTLPSGRVLNEEFAIVYIDRDHEGIFEVKADSLGWLRPRVAEEKLEEEGAFLVQEGMLDEEVQAQMKNVLSWLDDYDHNSGMRKGLFFTVDNLFQYFGFAVTLNTDSGIRYRHHFRINRPEDRRNKAETTNAQQVGAGNLLPAQ
ncbi:MAG: hypothetical protein ACSHYF_15950 [Verrucomicrobiaceae bacterium]